MLRADVEDLWQATLQHPFLAEIEQGTLPDEKLLFYFIQNVHYIDAAIAFNAEAAAKAPDAESREFALRLLDFGRNEVPRQREYVRRLSARPSPRPSTPASHPPPGPTRTTCGRSHPMAARSTSSSGCCPASGPTASSAPGSPPSSATRCTSDWLATFGGADHNDMNGQYQGVLDHLVEDAGPQHRRAELSQIFETSIRYEWMFWQMAYTLEHWPV